MGLAQGTRVNKNAPIKGPQKQKLNPAGHFKTPEKKKKLGGIYGQKKKKCAKKKNTPRKEEKNPPQRPPGEAAGEL